jgi:hypothetical protein
MESPYFTNEYFTSKKSVVDEFCASAQQIAERFARECKERNLIPSYYFFALWMEDNFDWVA